MYSEKLAIAVKYNGRVLREFGDTVRLPFGSEYSLFLKNLNSVRALVKIEIDGQDIADGDSFIVQAHESIDIERFLKGKNKDTGNRFKFIERTAKVEAGRGGIGVEDGLIRVEFEFEREAVPFKDYYSVPTPVWINPGFNPWPYYKPYVSYGSGALRGTGGVSISTTGSNVGVSNYSAELAPQSINCSNQVDQSAYAFSANACSVGASASGANASVSLNNLSADVSSVIKTSDKSRSRSSDANEAGITAPGSISNQKFVTGYIGALDGVKHVMVLKLLGEVGQVKIQKPVTVKSKQRCVTCNHLNKATSKFCVECGTGLEIVA